MKVRQKMQLNLIDILRYTRKHGSETEAYFINHYLIPTINDLGYKPSMDMSGNIWVETADKKEAPYLFCAHIDTCHRAEGMIDPIIQEDGIIKVNPVDIDSACLGADDAVGMYINLKMIEAGVKGTYLFTRGEECGGIGATYIATNTPEKLQGFLLCVEVDRQDTDEIITHQGYGKCASEDFALTLGKALGMGHKPSEFGVYTDCSEFAHIIPECVNIAAGYKGQHTLKETVNLHYVEALAKNIVKVDWSDLVIARDPGDYGDPVDYGWGNYYTSSYASNNNYMTDYERLMEYCEDYPERVANFLLAMGVEEYEIEREWSKEEDDATLHVGAW